jgi:hypothetical protein
MPMADTIATGIARGNEAAAAGGVKHEAPHE